MRHAVPDTPSGRSGTAPIMSLPDRYALPASAVLAVLTGLYGLGSMGLLDETEAYVAQIARSMLEAGDWLTPRLNVIPGSTGLSPVTEYPPLAIWVQALSFGIFGLGEWQSRLPAVLAALGTAAALWHVVRAHAAEVGSGSAWLAVLVLATSPLWVLWGRIVNVDMALSACVAVALLLFFHGNAAGSASAYRWSAVFLALGVLAKGPLAVLLYGLATFTYVASTGQLVSIFRTAPVPSMALLFCLVALPWYIAIGIVNGWDQVAIFLGFHNVERFQRPLYGHSGAIWYYLPVVALGFLPWVAYLPAALAAAFRDGFGVGREKAGARLALFAAVWLVTGFLFFSAAATKLPNYLLPVAPAVAILVALRLLRGASTAEHLVALALLLVIGAALPFAPELAGMSDNAGLSDAIARVAETGALRFGAAALLLGAALACVVLWRGHRGALPAVVGTAMSLWLIVAVMPALRFADRIALEPYRELVRMSDEAALPDEPVFQVGSSRPSAQFYRSGPAMRVRNADQAARIAKRVGSPSFVMLLDDEQWSAVASAVGDMRYEILGQRDDRYGLVRVWP